MGSKATREHRIVVWGARGGHGATTVAGAIGALLGTSVGSHDPSALEWIWPSSSRLNDDPASVPTVYDAGVITTARSQDTNLVVLRGPCSLAIKSLVRRAHEIDHIVVIRETGRPLHATDVELAIRRRVDSVIPLSPRVARLADAGLLPERFDTLDEFAALREWALTTWPNASTQQPS